MAWDVQKDEGESWSHGLATPFPKRVRSLVGLCLLTTLCACNGPEQFVVPANFHGAVVVVDSPDASRSDAPVAITESGVVFLNLKNPKSIGLDVVDEQGQGVAVRRFESFGIRATGCKVDGFRFFVGQGTEDEIVKLMADKTRVAASLACPGKDAQ